MAGIWLAAATWGFGVGRSYGFRLIDSIGMDSRWGYLLIDRMAMNRGRRAWLTLPVI